MPALFDTPSPLLLTGQDGTRNIHFPAFFCANRKLICRSKKRVLVNVHADELHFRA